MTANLKSLKFHFHNGGDWKVDVKHIGDLWIRRISTSVGRINGGNIIEIHPAQGLKIEILPEADTIETNDINKGSLEVGIFETVVKNRDIEWITLDWDNRDPELVYFPFATNEEGGTENIFMSAKVSADKRLFIVVDEKHNVDEVYA
ncbi:hypothetical protein [Eremococcus coleocola]|uniref:Uncharacterized protein n=1 Tax=Eremococcus coleocola ACS-139-V-Col8 TaxID=908337 RepID=E4KLP6_9LACT|nr:hypothetical protein [Eremococcus coleocola]EFR32027.1 hypothetical protein HMPREF9257_0878 [Eremococcus coleocola ACS-139-V-Col8]